MNCETDIVFSKSISLVKMCTMSTVRYKDWVSQEKRKKKIQLICEMVMKAILIW